MVQGLNASVTAQRLRQYNILRRIRYEWAKEVDPRAVAGFEEKARAQRAKRVLHP